MPNIDITPGSGKTVSTTPVGTSSGAYSASGEAASGVIYVSTALATAPTPVTNSNPFPVSVQPGAAIPASLNSAAINNGTTALTPKFAKIAVSGATDNVVVAAVAGKKIRVLEYRFSANGTVAPKWKSTTTTDLTGPSYLTQFASAGAAFSPIGHFETATGEALVLNLDNAIAVGGHLAYVEV